MPVSRKLLTALRTVLADRADPLAAAGMQRYMKSRMPYYGVRTEPLRRICRETFRRIPLESYERWHDTTRALWRGARYREERYCAIELCHSPLYAPYQTLRALPLYEEMIVTGAWWDLVDGLAPYRLGHLLATEPGAMKPVLIEWASHDDIWKRRSAILAQLRFKGATDPTLLYACIEPSLDSREFFLRKAIGWALRDYAWHDPAAVERYVEANRWRLSPLSRREALKNLDEARRRRGHARPGSW